MEQMRKRLRDVPLRSYFVLITTIIFCVIVLLSGAVIWSCTVLRNALLPEPNAIYMTIEHTSSSGERLSNGMILYYGLDGKITNWTTDSWDADEEDGLVYTIIEDDQEITVREEFNESILTSSSYTIQKIVSNVDNLSPKRKVLYYICGAAFVVVPMLLSFGGAILCCSCFYRSKLDKPLHLLSDATKQIVEKNLDFTISYDAQDELGRLCQSFEQMRSSLCENNKTMWEMLEERRQLQSSVAHDLRNPIAIIQGYIEYLQMHLTDGMLSQKRIEQILQNLDFAVSRLEHYTESLKTLNQLEDLTLEKKSIAATILVEKLISDCRAMLVQSNLNLSIKSDVPSSTIYVDSSALCRILENVIDNAMRFAAHEITLSFTVAGDAMTITVADDGPGFSQRVLEDQDHHPLPKVQSDGHMGMGLTIGRLLSQKHGGHLTLSNGDHGGAIVKIILKI